MPIIHDMAILLNEQLSENIGTTDEGYLICHNVPISRTGIQYYMSQEMGIKDLEPGQRVKVYRLPEDVFDKAALASIESKPTTDDHPSEAVTVDNAFVYAKGHARNIRHDASNVIADLVFSDKRLIQQIKDKTKFEISLGYTCEYEPYEDGFKQKNIRVNHIAVVAKGRAGPTVAIKDSVNEKRGIKPMGKQETMAAMFAAYAKDASPAELAEALKLVTNDEAPAKEVESDAGLMAKIFGGLLAKDEKTTAEAKDAALDARLSKIEDGLTQLLAKDEAEEEEKAAAMDEDGDELAEDAEAEVVDEDGEEEEKKPVADSLATLKKAIAKLPATQRKAMTDALAKDMGRQPSAKYAGIKAAVASGARQAAQDSAPKEFGKYPVAKEDIGKMIAAAHNPHAKEAKSIFTK